ncbi:SNARE associated protein (macronuclear) [Tetrahymena thermophila SB210]|uniref:SNARE associated protein n=1 Tax=Tetrahymena thermophila (strain SB210) TaxID=312017 RepID=I7MIG0_TETTS|nr:SNARE associated protein [Tetrahymena thermophila SB210]EAS04366.2 SNARE associated protein [Tetrahymena thermophila SB210]|eukprot:XP_001024611.2 SNARE associated protein [Tetrahymena thermophila SB210]
MNDQEDVQGLLTTDESPTNQQEFFQQSDYVQQRGSFQNTYAQRGYGLQRLSTIEEHQNEDELQEQERIKKVISTYTYVIVIYLIVIIVFALAFFLSDDFRNSFIEFFLNFKKPTPKNLVILFFIGVIIKITGFPISIYELTVAYIQQDFILSVCLLTLAKTTGCYVSFLISRYRFSKDALFWIQTVKELKVIDVSVQKYPFKISFLVRFMWLPIVVKNYGLGLFKISSIQFLIPTMLHTSIKSSFLTYIGINLSNFYDIVSGKTLADNIYIRILLILLGLILFVILFFICKKEYNLLEKEYEEKENERRRYSNITSDVSSQNNTQISGQQQQQQPNQQN